MKARIKFRKYGALRFIGHLDVMRYFQKLLRRAEIPVAYTSGYSPHMIMSFASPLGIGLTSDGEYFDIELKEPISSREAVRRMNAATVEGIDILSFWQIAEEKKWTGMAIVTAADYLAKWKCTDTMGYSVPGNPSFDEILSERLPAFLKQPEILVLKQTKRSEKEVDIRPLIYRMESRKDGIFMRLAAGSVQNLKPELVMAALCRFADIPEMPDCFWWHRLELYAAADNEAAGLADAGHKFVTLEDLGREIGEGHE